MIKVECRRVRLEENASSGALISAGTFAVDVLVGGATTCVLTESEALELGKKVGIEISKIKRSHSARKGARTLEGYHDSRLMTKAINKLLSDCLDKSGLNYKYTHRRWNRSILFLTIQVDQGADDGAANKAFGINLEIYPDRLVHTWIDYHRGYFDGYKKVVLLASDPEMENKIMDLIRRSRSRRTNR